ncbi:hypothetical protein QTP70_003700 [Hemibagrus guttatus]|uniref:Retrotransposon gag domain-containing protein n=1 Tax=Hemibagrus guttatus TaxID=175788 RepID=A0AAE0UUC2_9TELE|nr:hypothetical protein QTP70_003700 [Hemibagrus guttatus]KAK3552954.1 hypothetical protein QTP86_029635 [Hemibagrus guttatus]
MNFGSYFKKGYDITEYEEEECVLMGKMSNVWQENIPHTITPPPPAWIVDTRQLGPWLLVPNSDPTIHDKDPQAGSAWSDCNLDRCLHQWCYSAPISPVMELQLSEWIRTLPPPAELRHRILRLSWIQRSFAISSCGKERLYTPIKIRWKRCKTSYAARTPPHHGIRPQSPRLALPDKFDGSADRCRGFLRQCEVFFAHQPGMYSNEETQCAFVMSLLTNKALEWASAVWDADPQIRSSFSHFAGLIREVFEYPAGGKDISVQLMELRQGTDTAADYAITFRTLAAQSGWNDASLWAVFRAGLNPELQTELACRAEATTLSKFVATAICLDNLRRQHQAGAS